MTEENVINLILSAIVTFPFAMYAWKKAENGQWVLWYVILLSLVWG